MVKDTIRQSHYPSRWPKVLLVLWFLVLPFERIPTVEYHGFTFKASYLAGLLLILWAIFNIKLLVQKSFTASDRLLLLFGLIASIATLIGYHEPRNLIVLALWWLMIMLYFVSSRLISAPKIEGVILAITTIVCLFGVYQFIGDSLGLPTTYTGLRDEYTRIVLGFPRIQSVALEPLYFSNFLVVPLFLALKRSGEIYKFWNKYWWLSVLILINIILGQSRGAYLSHIVSLLLLVFYLIWQTRSRQIARVALGIIAAMKIS